MRQAVKELATNIAKALTKKLDKNEVYFYNYLCISVE
jgi:hypothetical protein